MNAKDDAMHGEVQVMFCDLCDESVPQTDIDAGSATRIKGRVVCATCNKAMAIVAPSAASASAAPSVPLEAHAQGPALTHAHAPAHTHAHSRASGSSAGMWVGVLGVLTASGVGLWAWKQAQQHERALADLRANVEWSATLETNALRDAEQRLNTALESARGENLRQWSDRASDLEQRLVAADKQRAELAAQLEALKAAVANDAGARDTLERHDDELIGLQQRYTALEQALNDELARIDGELAAQRAERDAVPTPQPEPETKPAWFALTEKLGSEVVSERWQAILALAETKDPAAAPYLVPALGDKDVFIRVCAARSLGDLANPTTVGALIDALEDPESAVRETAYLSLTTLTKRDLPFDAQSNDSNERQRRVKAWREWWEKERTKHGA
ncbi:MAG: HEAT repeat domain-containing protein [Planctomycetes bacterium]|nr:HEAT repeat domain-containing protein [Planctomycetota bacterium]